MDKKQTFLGICLFVLFFSILSVASASDLADDMTISTASDDLNNYTMTNNQEDILGDPTGNFADLDSLISGYEGSAPIDGNYTYDGDVGYAGGITIDKDITIDGQGFTLDASNSASIFNIGANHHVVFKNIIFINANGTNGGAIKSDSTSSFEIINCTFINNTANSGGAVYLTGDSSRSSTIVDSHFTNCFASGDGGAAYINASNVEFRNVIFEDNRAGDDGGAIYWEGSYGIIYNITCTNNRGISLTKKDGVTTSSTRGGTISIIGSNITLSDSSFKSSSAWMDESKSPSKVDGGAIFITGNNVTIDNVDFDGCNATNGGGAIFIIGNYTNILNCNFDNCRASDGGVIYVEGHDAFIDHNMITNNNCTGDGGALYVNGINVRLYNTKFVNNTAGDDGGAINWVGSNGTIYNITCTNNKGISIDKPDGDTSSTRGGTICLTGSNVTISKSSFTSCLAWMDDSKDTSKVDGGALFITGNNVNITHTTFSECNATHDGGAIYIIGNGTNILNCTFSDAKASYGGTIYIDGNAATIDNSTFEKASANDGGAIYVAGANATISKSNFSQLDAYLSGGAIYVEGNGAGIDDCNFTTCNAEFYHGGAIFISGLNTVINNSNFDSCIASGSAARGGAIDVEGDDTSIYNSDFDNNHAGTGGAIYVFGNRALIDNSSFEKDTANDGGAIYVSGEHTSIIDSDVLDCNATMNGGAISIEGDFTVINGTSFEKCNSLKGAGGSIYISGESTSIDASNFTRSIAKTDGGAILVAGNDIKINGCYFEKCTAEGLNAINGGGAIYITGSEVHISQSNFTGNKVTSDSACGGTIYIKGYNATIEGSDFNNSQAKNKGGIIFIIGEEAKILSSTLANSSSIGSGGAIYVDGDNTKIDGSDFANITAKSNGGAIYIAGAYTDIDYSSFYNCTTYGGSFSGGAIYINDEGTTISYSNFTKSFSSTAGAISINGKNTTIEYCNLHDNVAVESAGAIHILGDNAVLAYNNFTNNIARTVDGGALNVGGKNATVKYSLFDRNSARENGGAINWLGGHGDDSIIGSNFTNNCCNGSSKGGGAIFWTASSTSAGVTAGGLIKDCIFINNSANHKHGGAIDWFHALDSKIDNCTFVNNTSSSDGGALYTGDKNGGSNNLTISNSRFFNNTAKKHGGAISNQMAGAYIYNNTFDGNKARASGGTIVIKEGNADNSIIDSCRFYNSFINQTYSGNSYGEGGGSIRIGADDTNITIRNCVFINSTSNSTYAGAVLIQSSNSSLINVSIENSISRNTFGGAIYWSGQYGTLNNVNITNSSSNVATGTKDAYGGSIVWSGSYGNINNLTIINSSSNNNRPGNSRTVYGGAMYISGSNVTLTNSKIINSSSSSLVGNAHGGAIHCVGANASFENVSIINVSSSCVYGGAIYLSANNAAANNVTIINSTLISADSGRDACGGAIHWTSAHSSLNDISISNSSLSYNYVNGGREAKGGAMFINGVDVNITNIEIDNCSVIAENGKGSGGAIYRAHPSTAAEGRLINATISNSCVHGTAGGAIAWYSAGATVNNVTIINSSVYSLKNYDALGGAIYWTGGVVELNDIHINNSSVNYNYADGAKEANGGAIYVASANVKMIGVIIDNASAIADNGKAHGGAINIKPSYVSLINSSISNTFANGQGGAVYWTGGSANINNVTIVNSSTEGTGNTPDVNGGAIYATSIGNLYNILIINSSAHDNKSVYGGSIYFTGNGLNNVTVINSSVISDDESSYGGAIYFTGNILNNVTVINSSAISDDGTSYGGAVYWTVRNIKNMYNSSFTNSSADYGGAIYRELGGLNVYNTSFVNNSANVNGGAFYGKGGTETFYNATFRNNNAKNMGGAVYADSVYCHFYNSTLDNNTADYGGAIYYYNHPTNGRSKIEDTYIINNTAIQGSGIFATTLRCDFVNVTLLDNQAHSMEFTDITIRMDQTQKYISAIFKGYDNLLNGIWDNLATASKYYSFTNVTYWGVNGRNKTGLKAAPTRNNKEAWINITVDMFDNEGNLIDRRVVVTDANGRFIYPFDSYDESVNSFRFYHLEDRYYTYLESGLSNVSIVKIFIADIYADENATVHINLTDGSWGKLSGQVIVTLNDTDKTTIVIDVINGTGRYDNLAGLEAGTYNATANFTGDLTHVGDTDWCVFRVIPVIELAIDKRIDVESNYVNVSDMIKYTITVTNRGPSNATGVNITERLSEYLTLNRTVGPGYYNLAGGYWYIGDLNKGETATLEIIAKVNHIGEISNFVSVSGNELERNYTNNNASAKNVTALPIVDVAITKHINVTTSTVNVTDVIEFTITVKNNGPCNATGVYVNESVSPLLEVISAVPNIGTYYENAGIWHIGNLNTTFTAKLTIRARVAHNGTLSNVVTVNSTENDTNRSNNEARIDRAALNIVDLTVNKTSNVTGSVNVTDYIKFTITVHNNGPCTATNVNVTEALSSHLKLIKNETGNGYYDVTGGVWYIGNMAVGSTAVLNITAQAISAGTISNAVVVNSYENDTNYTDNNDTIDNITSFDIVDLSITKEVNVSGFVNVTDYIKFTITVHNNGPSNATDVNVTEALSPHLKLIKNETVNGYYDAANKIWHIGTLHNQSSAVLIITAQVISNGTIANEVIVTSNENDTDHINNNDTIDNITALPIVDLSINKTTNVTTSSLNFTDRIEFNITVYNNGPCNATGVYVSEILDSSLVLISNTTSKGYYNVTEGVWHIGRLNVGDNETLTIVAQVSFSGVIENEVIVYSYENDTDYTNNKDNISAITVSTDVDLEITKTSSTKGPVNVSNEIIFVIVVRNKSHANASGVVVSEILDPHLKLVSNTTTAGSYDGYNWTIGNLRADSEVTLTIVAKVISAGNISNAVNVTGYDNDTNYTNNNASIPNITAFDIVDLKITKEVNVTGNVNVTDKIKFTITVTNNGPSNATNVNVTEVLSSHLRLIKNETVDGYYDAAHGIWHIGTLHNQSTAVLNITAEVISAGTIANVVTVNSTENDTNKSNNKYSITNFTAFDIVDLRITKEVNVSGNVNVTDVIKFTITVFNDGPSNATNVNVSEYVGTHLKITDKNASLGYYNETTRIWYIGTLHNQSTAVLNITAEVISAGTIDNIVTVSSTENETNVSDNRAEVVFKAFNIVDVRISKIVNVSSCDVNVTDLIQFNITVYNAGPCNATGVYVNEALDSALSLISNTTSKGRYNSTEGIWYVGDLNVGDNETLTIVARIDRSGSINNEVIVTSIENDTNRSNNKANITELNATSYVDLDINKTVNVTGHVNVTDYVEFVITVKNNGPCNATGVYVNETVSPLLEVISAIPNVGTYYENIGLWHIGNLNTTFAATLTIRARVEHNGTVSNAVTVNSTEKDTNMSNNEAKSVNFTALNIVDLTVNKTSNVTGSVNVSDYIKFTITVHNNGPCTATGVNVSEVLSSHLKLIKNETENGYYNVSEGVWHIGTLDNQSTAVLNITAQVITAGTIANEVVITSNENDTDYTNNNDTIDNITSFDIVDLSITKEVNVSGFVNVTDYIKFTITVHNNDPSNATDVNVAEILSSNINMTDSHASVGYYSVSEGVWHIGTLRNQSTAVLNITAKVIKAGIISNVVSVNSTEKDTDYTNNNDTIDNITALPIVDLSINKTTNVTTSSLNFTDRIEFNITVYNNGPCNATGVYVSEILDSSLILISNTTSTGYYNLTEGIWHIGRLNVGDNETLTIVAQVAFSGVIENEVIVYSYENDTDYTNNKDNISAITVSTDVDLEITKNASTKGPVNVSDEIMFVIVVRNKSHANASGVIVSEILDPHLKLVSNTTTAGSYDGYNWTIGNLRADSEVTLTIVAKVISAGNISNAVNVTGYDNDTNYTNNNASIPNITAFDIVDLQITKEVNVTGNVNVSDLIGFTITVTNHGPSNATNVNVTEVLNSNLKMTYSNASVGYYSVSEGVWHIGTLRNQSTAVLNITARVIKAGIISNVVSVNSTEKDTDYTNNNNNITNFTAFDIVDLRITKEVNVSGNVNVTDVIKFTITVFNDGPSNATNVNVSEYVGTHLRITDKNASIGYYNETTRIWYIGTLHNQSTAVLNITAEVISAGTIDNIVNVNSTENETNVSDNRAELVFKAFNIVDVSITKTVEPATTDVEVTDIIKFIITVHNDGPCNATGVNVSEILDSCLTIISSVATEGTYNGTVWSGLELGVGDTETLVIVARVDSQGIINNEVIVTSIENDTDLSNNKANITEINATAYVDLKITKTSNATGYVNVTDYIEFVITVENNGKCNASNVNVTEVLDSHLKIKSNSTTRGTYDGKTWNIGYLNSKENATLTIVAQVISKGTIANAVVVTSEDKDSNKSNNNASIDDIIALPIVDLQINKTVDCGNSVIVSDVIEYRLDVKNNGPCDATNVIVNETLSPYLEFENVFVSRGSYNRNTGIWRIPTLTNQSSAFMIIRAKVISNGTIENVVRIDSAENDTDLSNNVANVTIEALKVVDLSIKKEVNVSGDVEVTDLIKFKLTVHNAGPCNATNVYVKEALDPALRMVNWTASKYTKDYDGYTWVIGNMSVGDTETFEIVARVVYSGVIENEVFVRCNENDTDFSNNIDNINPMVSSANVDLEIRKRASTKGPVNVTDQIEFVVEVHNNGPCNASGVYVQEILDPNLDIISYDATNGTYDGYTWVIGYLNDDETATLTIRAQVISNGTIANEAIVFGFDNDTDMTNNNASIDNITALPVVDLEITKRVDGESQYVRVGDIVQFTITVKNNGPSYATNVIVNETLSPHLEMITYLTWLGYYDEIAGIWYIGDLADHDYVELIIQAQVVSNGTVANSVSVSSFENDTNESNNHYAIENITAVPVVDLEITKDVNETEYINIGDYVEFIITVKNFGPSLATNVNVTEALGNNFKITANETETGYYNRTTDIWHIGDLAVGNVVTLKLTAQVIGDGLIVNHVDAVSFENDTNPYNNWAEAVVGVLPLVDVSIDKTSNVTSNVNVTDLIEFNITVHNAGPSNATGVYVSETLDSHLSLVSYNASAGSYDGFAWVIGNMTSGSTAKLTVIAKVISEGIIENAVTVFSYETDTNESNNKDNISSITATSFVDLTIHKQANVTGKVNVTDRIEFVITVFNDGPCNATSVLVSEALNPHLRLVSYNATVGTYDGFTWVVGTLNNGTGANLTIVAEVVTAGNITNVVVISSHENETNSSDNVASIDNVTAFDIVDLSVHKKANVTGTVNVTDLIEFVITVFNDGPCNATNVLVSEALNPHLRLVSYNATVGTYDGFTWVVGTLNNGTGANLTIVAEVITSGNITNVVAISSAEIETNESDNADSIDNITAFDIVDLSIHKDVNVTGTVNVTDLIEFVVTVFNDGPCNATNVLVSEALNPHLRLVSYNATVGTYDGFTWVVGTLKNGTGANLTIVAEVVTAGNITNVVAISSAEIETNGSDNVDSIDNITAFGIVDLSIHKKVNVTGTVNVTDRIEFVISVFNDGPCRATNVLVSEALNPNLRLLSYNATVGTYDGFTWVVGALNNASNATLTIIAEVVFAGNISNAVAISCAEIEINESDNHDLIENITALPIVDLQITKKLNTAGPINITNEIEFIITVVNNGPCTATGVFVDENIISNPNLKLISYNASTGSYDGFTWIIGTLNNASNATLSIVAKVISLDNITNAVNVHCIENDTNNSNNHGDVGNITVHPIVDLEITKKANTTGPVNITDKITFIIHVYNNGPCMATGVNVSEVLDSHLKLVGYDASIGSYDGRTWNIGTLDNGSDASLTIVATVISPGIISNVAIATSIENDTNKSNNKASINNITALATVDLDIAKKANTTGPVNVSDLIEFEIRVTNNGQWMATGVNVTEVLDSNLELVSYDASIGSYDGRIWNIGNLNKESYATLTIVARVAMNGTISNVVTATCNENDTNKSNNRASIDNITALPIVDLEITKKASTAGPVNVTDEITFIITVHNNGPCVATGVNVSEVLDLNLKLVSYDASVGSYDGFTWNIGTLGNGSDATLTIVVEVVLPGSISNAVSVTSIENDTDKSSNNASIDNITALPIVDVCINKTVNATFVNVNDYVSYTITVHNNGPCEASDVTVYENLSKEACLIQADATQGNYDANENIWYVGNLSNGSTQTLTLTVQIMQRAIVENTVTVTSKENDTNLTNNDYACDDVIAGKQDSPIDLIAYDIKYGEDEVLVVTLPSRATGTVNITVANRTYTDLEINDGVVKLPVSDLAAGNYTVNVTYGGDRIFLENSTSATFNVARAVPIITIEVEDIWVGEVEVLNVTVNAPGSVFVTVNNMTVEIPLENGIVTTNVLAAAAKANYKGKATWNIIGLPVGTYPAFALYPGNENYTSVNTSDVFHVRDIPTTVIVTADDIYVGEDAVIEIAVGPKGVVGNVTVNVEDKNYTLPLKNGKTTLTVPGLNVGVKSVTVWYGGYVKYLPSENATTFNVLKLTPPIDVDAFDINVGKDGIITVTVPYDATGYVTIEVEGKRFTSKIKDGKAVFVVSGLKVGEHDIKVYYSGDDKYLPVNVTGEINVNPIKKGNNDTNQSNGTVEYHGGIVLSDYPTGNPILMILLAALLIGSAKIRKIRR